MIVEESDEHQGLQEGALECGTTPAGALDGEELLPIELQCETTPAGALDHKELLHVELEMRLVPQIADSSHRVLESAIFRHFRVDLFWQELEIVLVGSGPRQIPQ